MIQSAPKSKIERWFEDVAMQSPDSPAFDDVDAENWKDVNEHVGLAGSAVRVVAPGRVAARSVGLIDSGSEIADGLNSVRRHVDRWSRVRKLQVE